MKKLFLFLIPSLLILFVTSCPQEVILDWKANPWYGHLDNVFNNEEAKIYVNFTGKDRISMKLRLDYPGDEEFNLNSEGGTYYIKDDHFFLAGLTIIDENKNDDVLWDNIISSLSLSDNNVDNYYKIKMKIELKGYFYPDESINHGDYKIQIRITKTDGTIIERTLKDQWELRDSE
jgi:hypothetical protein